MNMEKEITEFLFYMGESSKFPKILNFWNYNLKTCSLSTIVRIMLTVVALGPVTCETNGTGSQLTTVNKKWIINISQGP